MAKALKQEQLKKRIAIKAEIRVIANLVKRGVNLETAKKSLTHLTENQIQTIVDRRETFRTATEDVVGGFYLELFSSMIENDRIQMQKLLASTVPTPAAQVTFKSCFFFSWTKKVEFL